MPDSSAVVRREEPADGAAVRHVNEAAFGRPGEAALVDSLRRRGACALSLVAVIDAEIAGHIFFTPISIEPRAGRVDAVALGPLAVLPSHQRHGLGSQLVRVGLDECRRAGRDVVAVLGHPGYYPRFGFVPASRFGIRCEYPAPDEAFMIIELRPGGLAGQRGTVKYQAEFGSV